MQDLLLPVAREDDVDVALRNLTPTITVAVHTHGAEVHKVDI